MGELLGYLVEAGWCIHALVKYAIIGSDNDLFPFGAKVLSEPKLNYCQLLL